MCDKSIAAGMPDAAKQSLQPSEANGPVPANDDAADATRDDLRPPGSSPLVEPQPNHAEPLSAGGAPPDDVRTELTPRPSEEAPPVGPPDRAVLFNTDDAVRLKAGNVKDKIKKYLHVSEMLRTLSLLRESTSLFSYGRKKREDALAEHEVRANRNREVTPPASSVESNLFFVRPVELFVTTVRRYWTTIQITGIDPDVRLKVQIFDDLVRLSRFQSEITAEGGGREFSGPVDEMENRVDLAIERAVSTFDGMLLSAESSGELVKNMMSRINHADLREEAKMHVGAVDGLVMKLDLHVPEKSRSSELGEHLLFALGVLIEIEKRRLLVKELLDKDRRRRSVTVFIVLAYIGFALGATIFAIYKYGAGKEQNFTLVRVPFIGVPGGVLIWSLIGSFAAMIYRFNRNPIQDFGEAFKWLLTRPVQGIVLGATFYLVLESGLLLMTGDGRAADTSPKSVQAQDVILVLSFLVGFSDRFADSVFNALIETYSKRADQAQSDDVPPKKGSSALSMGRPSSGTEQPGIPAKTRTAVPAGGPGSSKVRENQEPRSRKLVRPRTLPKHKSFAEPSEPGRGNPVSCSP